MKYPPATPGSGWPVLEAGSSTSLINPTPPPKPTSTDDVTFQNAEVLSYSQISLSQNIWWYFNVFRRGNSSFMNACIQALRCTPEHVPRFQELAVAVAPAPTGQWATVRTCMSYLTKDDHNVHRASTFLRMYCRLMTLSCRPRGKPVDVVAARQAMDLLREAYGSNSHVESTNFSIWTRSWTKPLPRNHFAFFQCLVIPPSFSLTHRLRQSKFVTAATSCRLNPTTILPDGRPPHSVKVPCTPGASNA